MGGGPEFKRFRKRTGPPGPDGSTEPGRIAESAPGRPDRVIVLLQNQTRRGYDALCISIKRLSRPTPTRIHERRARPGRLAGASNIRRGRFAGRPGLRVGQGGHGGI